MKNSKNTKLIESYLQPLTATPIPCEITNNNDLFITNRSIPNSAPAFKQSNGKLMFYFVFVFLKLKYLEVGEKERLEAKKIFSQIFQHLIFFNSKE